MVYDRVWSGESTKLLYISQNGSTEVANSTAKMRTKDDEEPRCSFCSDDL
ncbi:hypothetical protein SNOG_13406 [Parastagonospora nodorum SN15]|uniref:Uncharacterized protein n=1 Tax=Phaeosphaeria nodorum (strain SN15 / ATCC MYA-4574 / FGSC 10173) TaxID=321614 RepID=Q0U4A8_PHANO|nr:hypothetical protein SNOG_13406 [Parastagonospora nodorum SN15]EAT79290.1 hypothetical protein SNOG_13406 [Parastagonospora nodorum SN15]